MAAVLFGAPSAYSQQAAPSRPAPLPSKTGQRSISDVLEFVNGVKEGDITESEAIEKIKERGVDFVATKENLARIRDAGASQTILDLIRKIAPEPPKPTASLSLTCAPAECDIELNGSLAGPTHGGQFLRTGMELGEVSVSFEKEGYITQQRAVQLVAGPAVEVSVALELSSASKQANGKELIRLMRHALGVETDLKPVKTLTAGGAITLFADGKQSDWNLDVTTAQPNLIEMKVDSATGVLLYQCRGEKCAEKRKGGILGKLGGGKQVKGQVLEDLQTDLRAFVQYNLAGILEKLSSSSTAAESLTASSDGKTEQHLRVENTEAVYEVTVGRDLLPSAIDYQSKTGLGSGLKVSFGDYTKLGDGKYPKLTAIRLPDSTKHGIEIRLDHVMQGSELRESDFPK